MSWARSTSAAACGEVLRGEPPVVGDDDALRLLAAVDDVRGRPRRRSGGRSRTCNRPRPGRASRRSRRRSCVGVGAVGGVGHASASPGVRRGRGGPRPPVRGDGAVRRATPSAAIVPHPVLPHDEPSLARADQEVVGPASNVSPVWRTRPVSPPPPASAARSADQRPEVAPTDVHRAHDDAWSRAAPSITATSIDTGWIRVVGAAEGEVGAVRPDRSASGAGCTCRGPPGWRRASTGTSRRSRRRPARCSSCTARAGSGFSSKAFRT